MPSNVNGPATSPTTSALLDGVCDISFEASTNDRGVSEKVELLNHRLILEHRIKEGAENLLNMELNASLRSQVESELDMAKSKIDVITKKIGDLSFRRTNKSTNGRFLIKPDDQASKFHGDYFRTALSTATSIISSIAMLANTNAVFSTTILSSSSVSHGNKESERQLIDTMAKLVDILRRNLRVRYELKVDDVLQAVNPVLGDKYSQTARAAAYRLLRYMLVDSEAVKAVVEGGPLDWYIVKTLSRDSKHGSEKEQALKLIRTMVEIGTIQRDSQAVGGTGFVPLSEPVMRAIVAIAEQPEDPFRFVCLQTVAEILLVDIDLVARAGGMVLLLQALGEGPPELSHMLVPVFLHIADYPRTREYLRAGVDLEIALSDITDAYGKGLDHSDRMRTCAKLVQLMLCTWSGLMYFSLDGLRAIRSVIDTLRIPSLENREIILDMFFDLFNIKTTGWYQTFIEGRRLTMYHKIGETTNSKQEPDSIDRVQPPIRLADQYVALLIMVFTHAGLCDALISMLEETTIGTSLSRKATLLLAELLQMANRMLPLEMAANIQAIPRLFAMATNYSDGGHRIIGTSAMSSIDSLNRNRVRLQRTTLAAARPRANSTDDAVRRGQRQVEQVKLKISMQMDDKTFQASLLDTQIMLTKDYTKWNFDTLQEIIEGPLLNPKRMEELVKVSRFIRRLMSFFHPFSHRYSDIPRTKANVKWVRLGCSLLSTLMATPDGVRYLTNEDQFLAQIVKSFAQLDPFNGVPDSDPIFSKKRVADTLTYGYLEMLGTLSKYKDGLELLEKFKVFTAFYHLSELRSREDLMKGIIDNLDYNFDGHPRIVFSKALTSSYKHIRLYATQHLGDLIRGSTNANTWTLRLLLTQLYDPAPEVCELAVHFLEEICESNDILQLVVEMQPTMDHLGVIGHPLLLKFMSTSMGFRYLYDAGYIDREMDIWFNERNIYYVVKVEIFLSKIFNHSIIDDDDFSASDAPIPHHFYGEMAKTELGCQILQEKGHFSEFTQFIRKHGNESDDTELIMKLKSILWAVGNVGSTEKGLLFLEEEEIIPTILEIAQTSLVPSIRGTCFFALGLISSTLQGAEILDDFRWEATLSPLGMPTGVCIPVDFSTFTTIPPWHPPKHDRREILLPPSKELENEIVTAIRNLANTVIANTASRSLAKMRSHPEYQSIFSSPSVFYRALHMISTQRYRLPVRRYIIELFNLEINPELVSQLRESASALKHPLYGQKKQKVSAGENGGSAPAAKSSSSSAGVTFVSRPVKRIVGFNTDI